MFDIEKYYEAETVEDAVSVLASDPCARVIAGGTDLLIKIRNGGGQGRHLVGIGRIDRLKGISIDGAGAVRIGPLTTFSALAESPELGERLPVLREAAMTVGGPQLRNLGTIGGNLSNGSTSSDMAPSLLALNAVLTVCGAGGTRQIPLVDFYVSAGKTVLDHTEIVTDILIEKQSYENFSGCYFKFSRREAMDISALGCACMCKMDGELVGELRLAYGVAGPVPLRAYKTENRIKGMRLDTALAEIGKAIEEDINPRSSWRASKEFRLHLASEIAARVLKTAAARNRGDCDA